MSAYNRTRMWAPVVRTGGAPDIGQSHARQVRVRRLWIGERSLVRRIVPRLFDGVFVGRWIRRGLARLGRFRRRRRDWFFAHT